MLRVIEMASAEAAKSYYTQALARADYYAEGQDVGGVWRGLGADRLSLVGKTVDQRTFAALIDNRHPHSEDRSLTPRTRTDRRPGYDLNFHAPKGLSVLAALMGDHRIHVAFSRAVRETMAEMEQAMQVRVRAGRDADSDRTTGNWIYGEFMHLTARPTGEEVPDPHLHMHCCAINASYDLAAQSWRAGQFGAIKHEANYFEAAFHARLARSVAALGYRIERRGKYWDLADVPESVVAKFSKRKGLIEKVAKTRGITDARALDRLGAATRAGKRLGLSDAALKEAWLGQLAPEELSAMQITRDRAVGHNVQTPIDAQASVRDSVSFAIAHTYERQSVASDKRLAEAALRHGFDRGVEVTAVWQELMERCVNGQLFRRQVHDQQLCTTREAYEETSRCIDYARDGMGCCRALAPEWEITRPDLLVPTAIDQRGAIQHVLRSTDRVIAVQGRAGTGKTFATQEIAAALSSTGCQIQALAPMPSGNWFEGRLWGSRFGRG